MKKESNVLSCKSAPLMFLERTGVHLTLSVIDVVCWFAAAFALVAFRYDFALSTIQWSSVVVYALFAALLQLLLGWLAGVYRGSNRIGSFIEASTLAAVTLAVGFIVGMVFLIGVAGYPNGVAFLAPFLALVLMGAARFVARAVAIQIFQRYKATRPAERLLIYGQAMLGDRLATCSSQIPTASSTWWVSSTTTPANGSVDSSSGGSSASETIWLQGRKRWTPRAYLSPSPPRRPTFSRSCPQTWMRQGSR